MTTWYGFASSGGIFHPHVHVWIRELYLPDSCAQSLAKLSTQAVGRQNGNSGGDLNVLHDGSGFCHSLARITHGLEVHLDGLTN